MSTLLSELALDYEILADDPIEKGIHFGQSILNHVSDCVANSMENLRSYSSEVLAVIQHPKVVEDVPIGQPITLSARAVKPRGSLNLEQIEPRLSRVDYRKRKTVNAGVRPVQSRGAVSYRPRSYASRSTFMVGGS